MAGEAETPFLKLKLPVIEGSAETWGELLNGDLQKIDVGVQTTDTLANGALMRGGTNEVKRTATEMLMYADSVVIDPALDGAIVSQVWVKNLINMLLPVGSIILWWGGFDDIPVGWALCDGSAHVVAGESFNTPDMQGLFAVGAKVGDAALEPGDTGGFATHEHNLSVNGTNLTVAQMPNHTHGTQAPGIGSAVFGATAGGAYGLAGGAGFGIVAIDYTGGTSLGSNGAPHNHTGKAVSGSSIPPYRALCYIMKVAEV